MPSFTSALLASVPSVPSPPPTRPPLRSTHSSRASTSTPPSSVPVSRNSAWTSSAVPSTPTARSSSMPRSTRIRSRNRYRPHRRFHSYPLSHQACFRLLHRKGTNKSISPDKAVAPTVPPSRLLSSRVTLPRRPRTSSLMSLPFRSASRPLIVS